MTFKFVPLFRQGTSAIFETMLAPEGISEQAMFAIQGTLGEIVCSGYGGGCSVNTVVGGAQVSREVCKEGWDASYAAEYVRCGITLQHRAALRYTCVTASGIGPSSLAGAKEARGAGGAAALQDASMMARVGSWSSRPLNCMRLRLFDCFRYVDFVEAVLDGKATKGPIGEAIADLKVCHALLTSAESRTWVQLEI